MILEVFGTPWMITETSLKTLIAIASRDAFFADVKKQALDARDGKPLENARHAYARGSVAVIPVVGPLIRHADIFSDISGATSYAALRKDLEKALVDPAVKKILFTFDSPGGEANGCFELADAIYDARKVKPTHAYAGGMCASAAYALASACETITSAAGAELGSIGVRAGYLDDRKALEAAGLKEWVFVSSQSPHKDFDVEEDDDRARLQVVLDDLASVFIDRVARGRGVDTETVLEEFGQGDVMVGARAVAAGIADQLGNFESLVAALDDDTYQPSVVRTATTERLTMTVKKETAAPAPAATMGTEKCDACGVDMGANSKAYCAQCYADDDDDDEDDDEDMSSALGLDVKATREQRIAAAKALTAGAAQLLEMTGAKSASEAHGKLASAIADQASLAEIRGELEKTKAEGIQRDLRTTLEAGLKENRLSLGAIQKRLPVVLRGEQKKAWSTAMGKVKSVTPDDVIKAACSVAISADDLTAIQEYAKSAVPIAAEVFDEPPRDTEKESAELDETAKQIQKAADAARKTLDRGTKAAKK